YTLPQNLFTDADNDTLTWNVSGLPDGLKFDAATRTLSGTPTASGEFTVTLTASDGKAQASHAVTVTVAQAPDVEPDNSAPVYNDQAGLNLGALQAGSAYHYTLPENLFSDADNDTLTWNVSGLPDGLSFDAATRTISGTPATSGTFTVVLTASDGKAQATHAVNVTVAQAPVEPQPETPDNSAPAPVILTTSSASVPDALNEREQEQPLSAIVAALSQTSSPAAHATFSAEFAAAQSHSAAERTAAPWVLDPVMQTLLPPLETVNFAARGNTV
ncbi:putative Ig domain-containing protein, partial [Candidatus Symbiopectobacterium sp. NZEC135]